jgi:hypothetical protein
MRDSLAVEKHYRVKELADLWGFSENTIIKLFSNEDGVPRLESPTGKRKYATLSIPETVAIRVQKHRILAVTCALLVAAILSGNPSTLKFSRRSTLSSRIK